MQLDDLTKLCHQQLLDVVVVVQENVVSLLDLCVLYEEMAGLSSSRDESNYCDEVVT